MSDISNIIAELEQRRAAIERALSALREIGGPRRGRPKKESPEPPASLAPKKRVLSPEGRKRIIEATKKRWANARASAKGAPQKKAAPQKKRRTLTAAGRARLSELMKARWASKNPPKPAAKR